MPLHSRNAKEYERKRTTLQKEIDLEHEALLKAAIHPKRHPYTSKSDSPVPTTRTKLPLFYKYDQKPPYSTNIPDNSVFSKNYDVESYLRRNLNPSKESLCSNKMDSKNIVTEKALVHERPKELRNLNERAELFFEKDFSKFPGNIERDTRNISEKTQRYEKPKELRNLNEKVERYYEKDAGKYSGNSEETDNFYVRKFPENVNKTRGSIVNSNRLVENIENNRHREEKIDSFPIPVLRHSPISKVNFEERSSELSEKMQMVEDKWKVPVVQKNILKSQPNEKGKNVSILTQLGSIRRQLQLEQLKLDKMLSINNN